MFLIDLLSVGPGASVYHCLVLVALGAMSGVALIEWRHTGNPDHRRALCAFGGLTALRLPPLLVESRIAELGRAALVAPFLGGIEIASLTLLGWAFLAPLLGQRERKLYLIGGFGTALLGILTSWPSLYKALSQFPSLLYITFWQQPLWHAVSMIAAILPVLIIWRSKKKEGHLLPMIGFVILFLGFTFVSGGSLTLTIDRSTIGAYTLIGTGRFIHLLGYPLLAVAVYHAALHDMGAYRHELQYMSEETLRQAQELRFLVEISRALGDSLNLDAILQRVVESIAMALNADRCAIFLVNPDNPESAQLAAQYTPLQRREQLAERPILSLGEQPALDYALQRHKQLRLNVEADNPRLLALYRLLGCQKAGPTIVQPILHQRRALGVLVVGNDHSQRAFEPNEGRMCQSIATQISDTLENIRLYSDLKTEARRLAELLQLREEEVRRRTAILESIPQGVIVSDREGRLTSVNVAAEHILGATRQRIVGRPLEQLLGDVKFSSNADWKSIARSDSPFQTMFELDGRIIHISTAPVLSSAGDQLGAVSVLRDVTQETRAEQAKGEFVTAISHELSTPLTAIRGYSEALASGMVGKIDEAQSHFIGVICDNALRMASLSDNLIAVAQIEKGFIQLEYGETNLASIISNVTHSFQSQLGTRQLEIELELDGSLPLIEADPARVQQILNNLISNAVKFTYPGGCITVGARLLGKSKDEEQTTPHCAIWVADTGIGISPEERTRIWERFYRPTNPLAVETSGLGVGLSIVKSLVEAHDGRVWLESTLGAGSRFTVLLPVKRPRPAGK